MNKTTLKLLVGLTVALGCFAILFMLAAIWLPSWQAAGTAVVFFVLAICAGCGAAVVADYV